MISYSGDIHKFDSAPEHYQEGPWLYKRGDLLLSCICLDMLPRRNRLCHEQPSDRSLGKQGLYHEADRTYARNHPGIADYKGKTYVFGHSYDILRLETPDHHERRSVNAAEMEYNADGTIKEVPYWKDIELKQIEPFNPFRKVEAETMAWGFGLKTRPCGARNMIVTNIDNGEYICLRGVDFGKKGAKKFFSKRRIDEKRFAH